MQVEKREKHVFKQKSFEFMDISYCRCGHSIKFFKCTICMMCNFLSLKDKQTFLERVVSPTMEPTFATKPAGGLYGEEEEEGEW